MKAINQDNKYAPGFRLKGHFLLSNGHPEQAVIAFYQSNTLEKDITSFSGDNRATFLIISDFGISYRFQHEYYYIIIIEDTTYICINLYTRSLIL
jgi:hypothetical protein